MRKINTPRIRIGQAEITACSSARNLGCIQDSCLSMEQQINNICKAGFYHLRNISKVRSYLTKEVTEQLIHAFVTTRLDQCNSMLYGIPELLIKKLQRSPTKRSCKDYH